MMSEVDEINAFMNRMGDDIEVIWGITFDDTLEHTVKVTLLATGGEMSIVPDDILQQEKRAEPHDMTTEEPSAGDDNICPRAVEPWNAPSGNPMETWMGELYPEYTPQKAKATISLEDINNNDDLFLKMETEPAFIRRNKAN